MSIAHHTRPPATAVLAPAFDAKHAAEVIAALRAGSDDSLATVSLYRTGAVWNTWRALPTTLERSERITLKEFAARFFMAAPAPDVLQPGQRVMWRWTFNPHFPQFHYAQSATIVGKTSQGLFELRSEVTTWSAFACEIHPL